MVPNRSSVLTVCLVAALVLSSCSGQTLSEEEERNVVEKFEERMSEIDGYHATMETTVTHGNETYTTMAEVWARPNTGEIRQEIVAPEERAGHVIVSNGSVMWSYDPAKEKATRIELPNSSTDTSFSAYLRKMVNRSDIVYNGTDTLDGQETHKVTLVPNESADTPVDTTTTLWLDKERMFPLKIHTELDDDTSTTIRFTEVELNPGLSDERFEFDPPEGAEVTEPEIPDMEEFEDRQALADAADRPVPDPDVPEGYTFERGTLMDGDKREHLSLVYANGTEQLTVTVSSETDVSADGETVEVGDTTGTYDSVGDISMVVWTCDETRYSVIGSLEKSDLVDVASSIDY